jgi:serine/threonine protein kinase/WD40 repeat protein
MDPESLAGRIVHQLEGETSGHKQSSRPKPWIPDHDLLTRIGGGSYGDVWLARGVTGNLYAIKVVWRENFTSDRPYEREFSGIVQFEPISRTHPGVVNVLHVGRDNAAGCFFYVMELADNANAPRGLEESAGSGTDTLKGDKPIKGSQAGSRTREYIPRTLRADLKFRGRLPIADVLALGVRLADALGHLHRHGLVHRDVKPSNVIFVNGQAKLADIGLVTGLDEARSFVGTEGFIPPEGPGTVQADVFGLGRLLYEAATGKDRCEFPDLASDLDQWPDRTSLLELNEILARACAPDPAARHANAAGLAGDLNVLLSGKSIRHAYGIERRLKRATLATSIAALLALLTASGVWFQRAQRQRADMRAAQEALLRQRVQRSEQISQERLRESLLQQALALTVSSEPDRRARSLAALHSAAEIRPGKDLRDAAVTALATPELHIIRRWNADSVEAVASRPDTTLKRYLRLRHDGGLEVRQTVDDAELLRLPSIRRRADFGRFSADGKWLVVKYGDASLWVWNLEVRTNLLISSRVEASSFAFVPDRPVVLAGQEDGEVRLVDVRTGIVRWRTRLEDGVLWLAVNSSSGVVAVATDARTTIYFLRLEDGGSVGTLPVPELGLVGGWSADGQQLITAQMDYSIRFWDWPNPQSPRAILRAHRSEPVFLASSSSGRWIASAGWDNEVYWSDTSDARLLLARPGGMVFSATDRPSFLWSRQSEWTLADFDQAFVPETILLQEHDKGPRTLAFSPQGDCLAIAGPDGVWTLNLDSHTVVAIPIQNVIVWAISFGADSRMLEVLTDRAFLRCQRGSILDREWEPPEVVSLPAGLELEVAEFASDAQHWVGLGRSAAIKSLTWYTGVFEGTAATSHNWPTPGMEFPALSADLQRLAWGNWRANDAFLLDLRSNSPPVRLTSDGSTEVAFSPNGRWFAVSDNRSLRFYGGDGQLAHSIPRDPEGTLPAALTFSADSRLCAIIVPPNRVELVDCDLGIKLVSLHTPEPHLLARVVFSPDSQLLAVASLDHNVILWDLTKLRGRLRELGLDW